MSLNDPYDILCVPRDASDSQIRRAFHRLALLTHPDKLPADATPTDRAASEERFKVVASAYEVLSEKKSRAAFDAGGWAGFTTFEEGSAPPRTSRETFANFFGAWEEDTRTEGVRVEERDVDDVFNLPLFEGYLVIDTRAAESRAAAPIASAIDCDAAAIGEAGGWCAWFASADGNFSHDRHSPVVVLGDEDNFSTVQTLAHSLARFLQDSAEMVADEFETAAFVLRRMRASCRRIWILRGGSRALLETFPVLGWPSELQPAPPSAIAPGVLLGSRAMLPLTKSLLVDGLRVTHLLVAEDDLAVAADIGSVERLAVRVPDDDTASVGALADAWSRGSDFIDAALAKGGCVLIIVHGRSRSASFALAWLARTHSLSAAWAARVLRTKCPTIDWSYTFAGPLSEWLQGAAATERERLEDP